MMLVPNDERVKLLHDIPDPGLHRGDEGLVCSTWFSPTPAYYEVEFQAEKSIFGVRTLLQSNQFCKTKEMAPVACRPMSQDLLRQ